MGSEAEQAVSQSSPSWIQSREYQPVMWSMIVAHGHHWLFLRERQSVYCTNAALILTMTTLPSLLSRPPPFILLQSSASRSALPILRWTLASHSARGDLILLSVLYPPATLIPSIKTKSTGALTVFDWTECIPGYDPEGSSYETKIEQIYNAIEQCMLYVHSSIEICVQNVTHRSSASRTTHICTRFGRHTPGRLGIHRDYVFDPS